MREVLLRRRLIIIFMQIIQENLISIFFEKKKLHQASDSIHILPKGVSPIRCYMEIRFSKYTLKMRLIRYNNKRIIYLLNAYRDQNNSFGTSGVFASNVK